VESFRRVRAKGCTRRVQNSQTYKLRFYNTLRRSRKTSGIARLARASLAVSALVATTACRDGAAPVSDAVSDDEYTLYAAWIEHHFTEQPEGLLLENSTFPFDPLAQNGCLQGRVEKLDRTARAMLKQYRSLGSKEYPVLTIRFQRPESKVSWRYAEISGAIAADSIRPHRLINFSRAVFNQSHTRAFFAVNDQCGGLCGRGGLVSAFRRHGEWVFGSDALCMWIA